MTSGSFATSREGQTTKAAMDALNAHDAKGLAALYVENAITQLAGAPAMQGREAVEKAHVTLFAAYTGLQFWAPRIWAKKNTVVLEWGWGGTWTGEFLGMKPSGAHVSTVGVSVAVHTDDRLIATERTYIDTARSILLRLTGKGRAPSLPTATTDVYVSRGTPIEDANIETVKRAYAALDRGDEAAFLSLLADDVAYDDMTAPETAMGMDAVRGSFASFAKAFPDAKRTVTNQFGADDFVITESTLAGTHLGAFGPFAATEKKITLHAIEILRVKDGRIVRGWKYANNGELLAAIGVR